MGHFSFGISTYTKSNVHIHTYYYRTQIARVQREIWSDYFTGKVRKWVHVQERPNLCRFTNLWIFQKAECSEGHRFLGACEWSDKGVDAFANLDK